MIRSITSHVLRRQRPASVPSPIPTNRTALRPNPALALQSASPIRPPMISHRTSQLFFSTAAEQPPHEQDEEPIAPTTAAPSASTSTSSTDRPNRPRSRRAKLDPLSVTEKAADRIKELLSGPAADGALGIRLGVRRRGCNGLSYTLNYAFEKPDKDDEMEAHGVRVFIEPMALFSVVGTTMDFEETELSSEFTFNNPNSKGECGCGESFNV